MLIFIIGTGLYLLGYSSIVQNHITNNSIILISSNNKVFTLSSVLCTCIYMYIYQLHIIHVHYTCIIYTNITIMEKKTTITVAT